MLLHKRLLVAGLLIASLFAALPIRAQGDPPPQLIPPSGPYAVGRTVYSWTDESREEVHTSEEGDFRELSVEVWYPADPAEGAALAPYLPDELAGRYEEGVNADPGSLKAVLSNAYPDAPLSSAETAYPVVLFDPGFSGSPFQYTIILEELASHGYIVFAPSHTYVTQMVFFPDGRVIEPITADQLMTLWAPDDVNYAEFVNVWVPDVEFVLDQIEGLNANDPQGRFTGHIDMDHLGLVGHSQGARTVSEVCLIDERCDAIVNLDGARSAAVDLELSKPFMLISADYGVDSIASTFQHGLEGLVSDFYVLMIPKTKHMAFADAAFWMPLVFPGDLPQGVEAAQIAVLDYRLYILSFLDKHVLGKDVPLLDNASGEHPEVFFLARTDPVIPPTTGVEPKAASIGGNLGSIPEGKADVWTYEGHAGEKLDIDVMADRPAAQSSQEQREQYNLLDTVLVVRAPDGSILVANDDLGQGTDSGVVGLVLPVDGTYQIEARSWESQTYGGYTLVISESAE